MLKRALDRLDGGQFLMVPALLLLAAGLVRRVDPIQGATPVMPAGKWLFGTAVTFLSAYFAVYVRVYGVPER